MVKKVHEKMLNTTNYQITKIKTAMSYHLPPVRMSIIKIIIKCWKGCEEKAPLSCRYEYKFVQPVENYMENP